MYIYTGIPELQNTGNSTLNLIVNKIKVLKLINKIGSARCLKLKVFRI